MRVKAALCFWACAACALLLAVGASAETRWTVVRTPTLTVIGDQSASTLRDVGIQMEQFREVVGGLFRKAETPLALPTVVFIFGERKAALPFLPIYNGKPSEISGYFIRGQDMNAIAMSLDGREEAGRLVYHEYTHLLVGGAVRTIPIWLNEGLAEYYSTYALVSGGKSAEVGRPVSSHVWLLRDSYMPLADLIAVDRTSPVYNEGQRRSIFYAESWALVHYLFNEMKGGPQGINAYASAIATGATPNDAFLKAFGTTPAKFDEVLRTYVRRPTFAGRRYTFDSKLPPPEVSAPRVLSGGEIDAWLGDLQRRIRREEEGTKRIERAVAADPSAAAAHLALGLLRLEQRRDEEGLASLKRAADLAPREFTTQFLHGLWLLRTHYADLSTVLPEATAALKRAVELKPDSPEPFAWLALAQMQEEASLGAALVSIDRAIELAPGQASYAVRRADIRARQGAYEEAKKALLAIAVAPSDPDAADAAGASLESLDRLQRRSAMAAAETSSTSTPDDHLGRPGSERTPADSERVLLALRKVQPGEQRAWGLLLRVDCSPSEVRFEVRALDRTIVASAPRMEDVDLISYLNEKDFTIACGPRTRPDRIYLTWKPDAAPSAARDGLAIAVEFLPRGYTP